MDKLLNRLGFNNYIHYKSSTEKYPYCLNNATIDIFSRYKPPFIILEDDIETTQDSIPDELSIPDNTDAFYLGLSSGGGHKYNNCDDGDSVFHIYKTFLKVKTMLSGHAILYINPTYILTLRNTLITKPTYYNDVVMSQIQEKFNIYTNRYPFFYQSSKLGGHEKATNIVIENQVTFVTAFLNITSSTNITSNYFIYFEKLAKTGISIVVFFDDIYQEYGKYLTTTYENVKILRYMNMTDLHINKLKLPSKLPDIRNNNKDTEEYLKLMNNKLYFVEEAIQKNIFNTNTFAWIDFRIFHIFKNEDMASKKLQEISMKKFNSTSIHFPGSGTNNTGSLNSINWRFLGGFFLLDKSYISKLITEYEKIIESSNTLSWEVNLWALIEKNINLGWYNADHDNTLINV